MKKRPWSVVDTLYWLGGGLIAAGIGLWALPAGLVAAGGFCLAGAVLVDLSAKSERKKDGDGA